MQPPLFRNSLFFKTGTKGKKYLFELALVTTFILTIILFGFLMVTDLIPVIGYIVLFSLLIGIPLWMGQLSFSTPINISIFGLLLLLPIGLALSHDQALSLVKIHGILLSIAIFVISLNLIRNLRLIKWAVLTLVVMAFFLSLLALLAADWPSGDSSLPSRILAILPVHVSTIQKLTSSGGIHVNTIGGTLALFVPLLFSLLFDKGAFKRAFLRKNRRAKPMEIIYKIIISIGIIFVLLILVMTQSRGAMLGSVVGVYILMVWKDKRFLYFIPLAFLAFFIAVLVFADGNPARFLLLLDTYSNPSGDTLQTRIEYWKNTIYLIQDFPITGTGIGTYGKIFHDIYSFATPLATVRPLFYAHNMYLAVAADMGLPALVLYLALFSGIFCMVFYTIQKSRSIVKTLLRGLLCGVAAHMVYGLMDNYMLGEKLSVFVWIFFGICTAVYLHRDNLIHYYSYSPELPVNSSLVAPRKMMWLRIKNLVWGIAIWLVISLVGISFININPIISLGIAVMGGIILGLLTTKRFENNFRQNDYTQSV